MMLKELPKLVSTNEEQCDSHVLNPVITVLLYCLVFLLWVYLYSRCYTNSSFLGWMLDAGGGFHLANRLDLLSQIHKAQSSYWRLPWNNRPSLLTWLWNKLVSILLYQVCRYLPIAHMNLTPRPLVSLFPLLCFPSLF